MNKSELISVVAERSASTKKNTEAIINALFETIASTLAGDEKVSIVGFGTFEISERSAREGVNPRTREKIQIEATRTPKFKAGTTLKGAVKNRNVED